MYSTRKVNTLAFGWCNTIILLHIRVALFKGQGVISFFSQICHHRQKIFAFAHSHKSIILKPYYLLRYLCSAFAKKKKKYLPLSTYFMYTYVRRSKNTLYITGTVCVQKKLSYIYYFCSDHFPYFMNYPVKVQFSIYVHEVCVPAQSAELLSMCSLLF